MNFITKKYHYTLKKIIYLFNNRFFKNEFIDLLAKYTIVFSVFWGILFLFSIIIIPINTEIDYSQEIYSDNGELIHAFLSNDHKWRLKTDLDMVSPLLIKSIINKEDKYFNYHCGYNPYSILKAFFNNFTSGKVNSGASTISMQVIRLIEKRDRTYINKFIEIFRAVQLEIFHSKDEILELYLSLLPYGGNIEGVESASYIYFNTPPSRLSLAQSVTLAIIPNNPNLYRIDRSTNVMNFRNKWLKIFKTKNTFEANAIDYALSESIVSARYEMPNLAPHFCDFIKSNFHDKLVNSSINLRAQNEIANILKNYNNILKSKGITNSSALVIDNYTHKVIAYCGSVDYNDTISEGQNNGITAERSPGSTLKAALYALAFDKGLYTPKSIINDIPTEFNGYIPENFDLKFYGPVSVEFALFSSLNIPAVKVLQKIGLDNFLQILKFGGFKSISKDSKKLGLSMILGGCTANLFELTRLFSAFACQGKLYNISYFSNKTDDNFVQLFSPEASFLINDILSVKDNRIETQAIKIRNIKIPDIAWKTGTSFGKRDAWTIGFNSRYTVGVWSGNFNGNGSPFIIGSEIALPIVCDIFNSLPNTNTNTKKIKLTKNLAHRYICRSSGKVPNEFCTELVQDYYIGKVTNSEKCDIHKQIFLSSDSSVEYCTGCLPDTGYIKAVFPVFEPSLTMWFEQNSINYRSIPNHNLECKAKFTGEGPIIISPSSNYVYYIEQGAEQEISLQAINRINKGSIYWYIDGTFYNKSKTGEKIFFKPEKEYYTIKCIDFQARESSINVKIIFY